MTATTTAVSTDTFAEKVLANDKLVLVDFWADWCQPCHRLAPILEELAAEKADELVIAKVDTEAHPDLATQYGIRAFPTLKLFRDGRVVHEIVGAVPKRDLLAELSIHL